MTRLFFFYGTLRQDIAQGLPARLVEGFEPLGPATTRGRLFARRDLGGVYPVLRSGHGAQVTGMAYRVRGLSRTTLLAMDLYEGAVPGGEYARRTIAVQLAGGTECRAQAYVENGRSRPGLALIGHGDFARYLKETGMRPFTA